MKKILKKITLFLLPLFLILLIDDIYCNYLLAKNDCYKIDSSKTILILGHSQLQFSVNDSLIENTISVAQMTDPYFYIYYKFKKLAEANKNINTLILGYSNNVFAKYMDDWVYKDICIEYKYPKYSQLLSTGDKMRIFLKNPTSFLKSSVNAIKIKSKLVISNRDRIYEKLNWGGYQFMTENEIATAIKKEGRARGDSLLPENKIISELNIEYLRKIILIAKEYHVRIILVRSPLHHLYPKIHETELQKLLLEEKFKAVQFWDYGDLSMSDSDFIDLSHLNHRGAYKFSQTLRNDLQKNGYLSSL